MKGSKAWKALARVVALLMVLFLQLQAGHLAGQELSKVSPRQSASGASIENTVGGNAFILCSKIFQTVFSHMTREAGPGKSLQQGRSVPPLSWREHPTMQVPHARLQPSQSQ